MKKIKFNDNKQPYSSSIKNLNTIKTQKTQNYINKKDQNKLIKKPILKNTTNTDNIKETKFQSETKTKSVNYLNYQKNNIKNINDKADEKNEIQNNNKNQIIYNNNNNTTNKTKTEEIIDNTDATIVVNNEINNEINEDKKEEINNNNKLKLTKEEINKLLNNVNKTNKNFQSNDTTEPQNLEFDDKTALMNLKDKQKSLFNEMDRINMQKKYLNEYSLNNLPIQNNTLYKKIQNNNIKNLEQNENNILEKISDVEQQLYQLNDKGNSNNNINKKEEYLERAKEKTKNDENDKKYKKIMKESNIACKNVIKIAEKSLEKRINEMNLMEKEENEKKMLDVLERIKNEKKLEKKRRKEIQLKVAKNKVYINNNMKGKKKNYLFFKMATSFEKREEKLINQIKKKRLKLRDDDEQKEMEKNDYLAKKKLQMIENINNLHQMWKERSDLLPKYKSPMYQKILYSEENIKENEKIKLENKKKLYYDKEKYCKEKIHLPPISNILIRAREKKNFSSLKKINIKGEKNINYSIDSSSKSNKYLNYKNKNNKNIKINYSLNSSNDKKLIKSYSCSSVKNTNIMNNPKRNLISFQKKLNLINKRIPSDFNYLEELRRERLMKNKNKNKEEIKEHGIENNNNNQKNNNKDINIDAIKGQIKSMEEKYNRDNILLKIKGGYVNNQEFGDKINELLVNSIKNKLSMIENMNK